MQLILKVAIFFLSLAFTGSIVAAVSEPSTESAGQGTVSVYKTYTLNSTLMADDSTCNYYKGLVAGLSSKEVTFTSNCPTYWTRHFGFYSKPDWYTNPQVYLEPTVLLKVPAKAPDVDQPEGSGYFVEYSLTGYDFKKISDERGKSALDNCLGFIGWFSGLSTTWISFSGRCTLKESKEPNAEEVVSSVIWVRAKIAADKK